jgi:hypothetical protein
MIVKNLFFKECVIKLGFIYLILIALNVVFLEYRTSQNMWWANIIIFAGHDKLSFLITTLMIITLIYGFYLWIKALLKFVIWEKSIILRRFLYVAYLFITPITLTILFSELYSIFSTNPHAHYKP